MRLCKAERGYIFRFDGETASRASPATTLALRTWNSSIVTLSRRDDKASRRRAALERRTVHVADIQADPEYAYVMRDVNLASTSTLEPQ